MAKYSYTAKNMQGVAQSGELEGESETAIAAELIARKLIPISIEEATGKESLKDKLDIMMGKHTIKLEDMSLFCRQMAVLIKAGVPVISALQRLSETTTSIPLSEALEKLVMDISAGQTLTAAMAKYPHSFRPVMISVTDAGENSGRLDLAFAELSKYFMMEATTRQRIKAALRYPIIVISAIFIAIIIINIVVVPAFEGLFATFKTELPLPTRMVIASSNFMLGNWKLMLVCALGGVFFLKSYLQTEMGRLQWDKWTLKLPIVGMILLRIILGRFSRIFSMVLESGVPLVKGIDLAANALGNTYMRQQIESMKENIERGESLSRSAAQTKLFTPLVLQMLIVGEETGNVDGMLKNVAEFYDQEVDYDLSRLGALMEPIILVILGVMVGILAFAVFLPIWGMTDFVKQG